MTVTPIAKCEYILRQFASHAVQELADTAHSLITPVLLGLTKPSTFKLASGSSGGGGGLASTSSLNTFAAATAAANSAGSGDYLPLASLGGHSGQYALAEEIFNLEASLHRQFTSSVSTTLITAAPLAKKEQPEMVNPGLINPFVID